MNIVAHESVDGQIVERLGADGHTVQFVAEFDPGIGDEAVLLKSREANATLLTADKDVGELVFCQDFVHSGGLLIRLNGECPALLEFPASANHAEFRILSALVDSTEKARSISREC